MAALMMLDDVEDERLTSLSDAQQIILCVLMIFSGCLSVFGSATIIYRVIKNPTGTNSYNRIMLGLSFFDILASMSLITTPFLLPAESSHRIWAIGTDVSCTFLGWMTQLAFAALAYNTSLSFYFVSVLKFGVSNEDFAAKYEAYIHGCIVYIYLFMSTVGVPLDLYREVRLGYGCWIADIPANCWVEGGCVGPTVGWFYGGLILMIAFIGLPVNNLLIYCHGKRSLQIEGRSTSQAQNAHLQRLATQCSLYVATFFATYTPQMTIRILGSSFHYNASREHEIFWVLVLNSILFPLQGFFNMFVYSRPKWLRLREAGIPWGKALMASCFEPDVGGYIERSVHVASSQASKASNNIRSSRGRFNSKSSNSGVSLPSIAEGSTDHAGPKKVSEDFDAQATLDTSENS